MKVHMSALVFAMATVECEFIGRLRRRRLCNHLTFMAVEEGKGLFK